VFLFLYSFNGLALWLPDLYSRLALYSELNPNHTLTICDVVAALADSNAAADTFVHSTEIDIQMYTEINNLTYTELMKANNTVSVSINPVLNYAGDSARYDVALYIENNTSLLDMVAATNGTWLQNNITTPTCSSTVNPAVFRNSLAIGVVCAVVYTSAGYMMGCIDRKKLMSKFKHQLNNIIIATNVFFLAVVVSNSDVSASKCRRNFDFSPRPGAQCCQISLQFVIL
jgi:hypothetical protein